MYVLLQSAAQLAHGVLTLQSFTWCCYFRQSRRIQRPANTAEAPSTIRLPRGQPVVQPLRALER